MTRKSKSKPEPISLRAYAKRRGVSAEAVSKAITAGRLKESVVRVGGAPKISDPDLADQEWGANTQPRADVKRGGKSIDAKQLAEAERVAAEGGIPSYEMSRAIREWAAARREVALADMAEIDVEERRGELVGVEQAREEVVERFTVVRTKLLGLPARVKQRLSHIIAADVLVIDDLVREALEELADDDAGDEAEDEE